jgi:hypothetical protein
MVGRIIDLLGGNILLEMNALCEVSCQIYTRVCLPHVVIPQSMRVEHCTKGGMGETCGKWLEKLRVVRNPRSFEKSCACRYHSNDNPFVEEVELGDGMRNIVKEERKSLRKWGNTNSNTNLRRRALPSSSFLPLFLFYLFPLHQR